MTKHNKLHNPKKFGFKKKTRSGNRVYIYRIDSTNKGRIIGVILEREQIIVRVWQNNGRSIFTNDNTNPYDLIPLKNKKYHLTKIDVPLGKLDKDTQKRLKTCPPSKSKPADDEARWLTRFTK